MSTDSWGEPIVGVDTSVDAWNTAWAEFMHFEGDPLVTLADANATDTSFVLGSVFVAIYSILGGLPFTAESVAIAVEVARSRLGTSERERVFVEAMGHVIVGDFSNAADTLDRYAVGRCDLAAVRIAHDIYLHVGDAAGRLRSSRSAIASWTPETAGWSFVMGQLAFALEEAGQFDEAERVGRTALDADPLDLWARHALVHVFESTENSAAFFALLDPSTPVWERQESLALHMWWHIGVRCLQNGDVRRVIEISDRMVPEATSPFRLCDVTALLWRLELAGHSVGDRWAAVAERWDATVERHSCAFIDVHASMAFARRPDHVGAARWSSGLAAAWLDDGTALGASQNSATFRSVVRPLAEAFDAFAREDLDRSVNLFDAVASDSHRIGGSNVQRAIISTTRQAAGGTS
jgi:hypothetical protein